MANWARQGRWAMLAIATALWACKGNEKPAEQPPARDLSLAPAESTAQINDRPTDQPAAQPKTTQPKRSTPPRQRPTTQSQPESRPQPPAPAKVETPTLAGGTSIDLVATDTVTSRTNKKGEAVTATTTTAIN